MSESSIQALLDGLAAELGVGVTLLDNQDRVIAHTAHHEPDDVRRNAILELRAAPEVLAWFSQWGIADATGPVSTPAEPALGLLGRWCIPIHTRGRRLGELWLVNPGTLGEGDLSPAVEAASQIGVLLHRRRLMAESAADLMRLLLLPTAESETVAAELRELGLFTHVGSVAVVAIGTAGQVKLTAGGLDDLRFIVQRVAAQNRPSGSLATVIGDLGVLVAPLRGPNDSSTPIWLAEKACRMSQYVRPDLEVVAAVGAASTLECLITSYTQAVRTIRMVRAVPELGPIGSWDGLGIFRTLALLPTSKFGTALDPRVRALLSDTVLVDTAEAFLDLAGSVQTTAERLFLHRATLYQRLDRIASNYGLDLRRSGADRLVAHVGLKVARIMAAPSEQPTTAPRQAGVSIGANSTLRGGSERDSRLPL